MNIDFQFKGNRNYVHGTDMVNKYLSNKSGVKSFSIQIKKMTSKNLRITNNAVDQVVVSEFIIQNNNKMEKDYFVETEVEASGRYDYDEEALVSEAQIKQDEKSISMDSNNSYTFIENVVALNKKLVTRLISDEVKWLFVGLELTEIPIVKDDAKLLLSVIKNLGTKLVQSKIALNEKEIGTIKFSSIK
jgi:hypothetical protein